MKPSKFRGVEWDTEAKGWLVRIGGGDEEVQLGPVEDEELAAHMYDTLARKVKMPP